MRRGGGRGTYAVGAPLSQDIRALGAMCSTILYKTEQGRGAGPNTRDRGARHMPLPKLHAVLSYILYLSPCC